MTGFPERGLEFLRQLKMNNNKEWFNDNRTWYDQDVLQPAKDLVQIIGERLQAKYPSIQYDTRANGSGSLMRISRDTRFSKDKTPYKSNVAMIFWDGSGKKMEMPGFGLQITAMDGAESMAGAFNFSKAMLKTYRDAVVSDKYGPQLLQAVEAVKQAGAYTLNTPHYKRTPKGYDRDHPRAEWLLYSGLWASSPGIPDTVLTSDQFVDTLIGYFVDMAPIQQWLTRIINRAD